MNKSNYLCELSFYGNKLDPSLEVIAFPSDFHKIREERYPNS